LLRSNDKGHVLRAPLIVACNGKVCQL
jgi:hypothetical protein